MFVGFVSEEVFFHQQAWKQALLQHHFAFGKGALPCLGEKYPGAEYSHVSTSPMSPISNSQAARLLGDVLLAAGAFGDGPGQVNRVRSDAFGLVVQGQKGTPPVVRVLLHLEAKPKGPEAEFAIELS